jgi:alpha-tubulin suppressor-like RCC1 family protein
MTRITAIPSVLAALCLAVVSPAAAQLIAFPPNPLEQPEVAVQLSVGEGHSCLINNCGKVRCWGENGYGEINAPPGVFTAVAAGRDHSCALDSNGNPRCWGDSRYGQTQHPAGPFVEISAGGLHSCGLRANGSVACWGHLPSPTLAGSAIHIDSGRYHACAVVDTAWDRRLECWGRNSEGQSSPPGPLNIPHYLGAHQEVSAGGFHSCSLTDEGLLQCWGYDAYRQVSGQHPSYPNSPWGTDQGAFFDFPNRWNQVDAGLHHTCALQRTSGSNNTFCWGYNAYGQSTPPGGRFDYVGAGDYFSCGLRGSGQVECWGMSSLGRTSPPALTKCEIQLVTYKRPTF